MIVEWGTDHPADAAGSWDVCIIGAGAVGLALAAQFIGDPRRVLVLESGRDGSDEAAAELSLLDSVGTRHDGWRDGRVRGFGGTTRSWGGQLVPMRASEFAARPWVPESGWPLTLEEMQPYYRRTELLLRTAGPPYDESVSARLGVPLPAFDPATFCVRFSQWASLSRRNFAVLWRRQLARAGNITVLLGATAAAVRCSAAGNHCEGIEVRAPGRATTIRARQFVIACGGIESARLLLASPSADGRGVANRSGTLGCFFQDHISYVAGELMPHVRGSVQSIFDPRYLGNTMYSLKVEPTDRAMREHGWLNAMGHIAFQIPAALGWMEARRLLRSLQAGRLALPSADEARALAGGGLMLTRLLLARWLTRRRRSPDAGRILLLVDSEQAPNAISRVSLDSRVDALGMPRARLDWRPGELEQRTLTGFSRSLAQEFARLNLGQVRLAQAPDFNTREELGSARDIFHHMGTTRMSLSADHGVTRPDLRCHDVDNLFIAGGSVFPASGIANPTFTALALALRLADQLKAQVA
jgi:choline dehydrogenase-like flavoprotein